MPLGASHYEAEEAEVEVHCFISSSRDIPSDSFLIFDCTFFSATEVFMMQSLWS